MTGQTGQTGHIGKTVRFWQDVLARLHRHRPIKTGWQTDHTYGMTNPETGAMYWTPFSRKDMVYPQSLGELCLELANEGLVRDYCYATPDGLGVITGREWYPAKAEKIASLRQALYHRHKGQAEKYLDRMCPAIWVQTGTKGQVQ